jgi:hypothetical protein
MSEFHAAFAAMVSGRPAPQLERFLSDPGAPGLKVYRNNVAKGAAELLAQAYPAVARLVGDRFFTAMAVAFRDSRPPQSATLALYGEGFDAFIERFGAAASLPYLPDIARLDRAWLMAHHAADRPVLRTADLAGWDGEALAGLRLRLHPGATVLAFQLPAYSIWRTNREDASVMRVGLTAGPETALVWRREGAVRHRRTSAGQHVLISAIRSGAPLHAAAQAAASRAGATDPVSLALGLIDDGLFERSLP